MKKLTEGLKKKIAKLVQDHYTALGKQNCWTKSSAPCFDFSTYAFPTTGIGFDVHVGEEGERTYRWLDEADVLIPKLKKLTGADRCTVGVLGDLSNVGGIHVSLFEAPKK